MTKATHRKSAFNYIWVHNCGMSGVTQTADSIQKISVASTAALPHDIVMAHCYVVIGSKLILTSTYVAESINDN